MRNISFFLFTVLLLGISGVTRAQQTVSTPTSCITTAQSALDKLVPALVKNDFDAIRDIVNVWERDCGKTEFLERIRILQLLISKSPYQTELDYYYNQKYDQQLIKRWNNADKKNYKEIYSKQPSLFDYVPLRHQADSLLKLKAKALLYSDSYQLADKDRKLIALFADDFNEIAAQQAESNQAKNDKRSYTEDYKDRVGYTIYAGVYGPLGGTNTTFGYNPVFGLTVMSSLRKNFIFEGGIKVRINSSDRDFQYLLYNETMDVNSAASFSVGGNVGYKALDRGKFMLIPKLGIGWEVISTGLSETVYNDNYVDEYGDGSSTRFHNVNTLHLGASLAGMYRVSRKNYIGLEIGYHYTPYQWDSNLITDIYNHYGSVELFFRF